MDARRTRFRNMRSTLYRLKREFGLPISVHLTSSTSNVETGVKEVTRRVANVARAVILPSQIHKEFKYDIGYLRANSNFTYGALYTEDTRQVLIDRNDLPGDFTIEVSDHCYVVFDHKRYAIKKVDQLEIPCYYVTMQETKGTPVNEVHVVKVHDRLTFTESFAGGRN